MITAELSRKIDTLSNDEYQMAELYVDNVVEYSKRRKKLGHGRRLKLISWSQKEE